MTARSPARGGGSEAQLRAWLAHVIETAIDWLDQLDADQADREDDELGDDQTREVA